ncbi:MAG: helix-turn-helix domain-containing protein [Tetragenococcus halophilus]|nr:helix-turn-helix domain-containing protein [Tetragenococcus halophilus]
MVWEKIEEELQEKNWSIYKLTKEAGLKESYLYNVKSGQNQSISFKAVCKIADALEISLDEFREEE